MEYKIIERVAANELLETQSGVYEYFIAYNFAKVYKLDDGSFMVVPLSPFGNCIQAFSIEQINKWVEQRSFPIIEKYNSFYFENKDIIDNFNKYKDLLKSELLNFVELKYEDVAKKPEQIDRIQTLLKSKRKWNKYKLPFLCLVGDYLIENILDNKAYWGVLEEKFFLTPLVKLILIKKNEDDNDVFYQLQDEIIHNKYGYLGLSFISDLVLSAWTKPDEISKIRGNIPNELVK